MSDPHHVIKLIGTTIGIRTEHDDQWLVEYDPDGGENPYAGRIVTTPNLDEARRFTAAEATATWMQVSKAHPTRPDGKPNRPLTAFSVEISNLLRASTIRLR